MRINKSNRWIKGKSYQKRILTSDLKDKIDLIEDIIIKPKGEIPLHAHRFTDEIFYVIQNKAMMIVNDKEFEVEPGDFIFVSKYEKHSFRNESDESFKMIVFKLNFKKEDSYLE